MNIKLRDFQSQILYFNGMYKLPVAPFPTILSVVKAEMDKAPNEGLLARDAIKQRLNSFKKTLLDEVQEVDEIIDNMYMTDMEPIDVLTELADWLGDIQVYCASEMAKFGIPQKETLAIIMQSNFSKLQADGTASYDEHGKVQKGPAYWKPEPQLKQMLEEHVTDNQNIPTNIPKGIIWRD